MNDKETGGSAFPVTGLSGLPNDQFIYPDGGMTLRDYFAGKAISGIVSGGTQGDSIQSLANLAYMISDAMIAERSK